MRIVVLDDMVVRHQRFASIFEGTGADVLSARTIDEFIFFCKNRAPDVVCLDHDLNDAPDVSSTVADMYGEKELTGLDAALWLVREGLVPPRAIVHSVNPQGAKRIADVLSKAGCDVRCIPFRA